MSKKNEVKYNYDAKIGAVYGNLSETYEFTEDCTMEGFFVSFLRLPNKDIRIWFKPDEWLKTYYGFSKKQYKGIELLSEMCWNQSSVSIIDFMADYKLDKLNKKQRRFMKKMLSGANDFIEGLDVQECWK